jgi:hypothetical protein
MDGALEADVALIQTAMNRVDPTIERVSNTQMDTGNAAAVARFGTRLATRRGGPEAQVPEKTGLKKVAERVGFEPTCRNYPTIRFRVGAVMTTSVPLRLT